MAESVKATDSRSSIRGQSRWRLVLPPLVVLTIVAGSVMLYIDPRPDTVSLDADLCPADADNIAGSVVFLLDLTKPLHTSQANLPSGLLHEVTTAMGRNHELRLFSLAGSQIAPRTFLSRICKPYATRDLQIHAAKDHAGARRDCDDLPAQLPVDIRESATAFCAKREALKSRLDALAQQDWPKERKAGNAFLVGALEDIRLDFTERPEPHVVYLFSDMMQHAAWYSHLDQEWTKWNYDEFAGLLESQNWALGDRLDVAGLRVEIFYLPRGGWTDQPRVREVHQRFWREYFAGAEVAFHNQPSAPPYLAVPLMNVPTEVEIAARERLVAEQLLEEARKEQDELEEQRQRLLAEQQRLDEQREQLRTAEMQRLSPAATIDETGVGDQARPTRNGDVPAEPGAPPRTAGMDDLDGAAEQGEQPAATGTRRPVAEVQEVRGAAETGQQLPRLEAAETPDGQGIADAAYRTNGETRHCDLVMSPNVVTRTPHVSACRKDEFRNGSDRRAFRGGRAGGDGGRCRYRRGGPVPGGKGTILRVVRRRGRDHGERVVVHVFRTPGSRLRQAPNAHRLV